MVIDWNKQIKITLTTSDLDNILDWYRIAHHYMGFKACTTPIRYCHSTKNKILDYKNKSIKGSDEKWIINNGV